MIKPNICNALPPTKADTTHPLVVKAVAELVKDNCKNIEIGESSASILPYNTIKAFRISGIEQIADELGIKLRNLSTESFTDRKIPKGKIFKEAFIANAVFEADTIINIPKFKTHKNTFITGAVKNCFALLKKRERNWLHDVDPAGQNQFSQGVIDVFSVIKSKIKLNVMDAVVGMEGFGTAVGKPKRIGLILASEDAVALDAVIAEVVGFPSSFEIPLVKFAHERRLGTGDVNKIKICGEKLNNIKISDFELPLTYIKGKEFKLIPIFNENCIKCGECIENCPRGAISKDFKFDRKKCVCCFICQETCSNRGISTMKLKINSMLEGV